MFNGLSQLKKGLSKGAIHGLNGVLMQGLNSGLNPRTKKTPTSFRIVIDKNKCGASNSTDFPFLFSFSDKFFSNISYGGRMFNRNGYDILFYSDAAMSVPLSWEIEYYDATTGTGIIWIKTNITYQVDTYIYGKIGVPSINTFQSVATSAWDSNYKRVLHLPNGITLSANDSTSNAANGTVTGSAAAAGKIDGGVLMNSSTTDYITFTDTPLTSAQAFSISWWEKVTADTNNFPSRLCIPMNGSSDRLLIVGNKNGAFNTPFFWGRSAGATVMRALGGASLASNIGTWRKVLITGSDPRSMTAADWKIYLNGSAGTVDPFGAFAAITTNRFGYDGTSNGGDATFDELRISDGVQRSADWELTEYNNQSSPSTFFQIQIIK